jgi:hypothetical protein
MSQPSNHASGADGRQHRLSSHAWLRPEGLRSPGM